MGTSTSQDACWLHWLHKYSSHDYVQWYNHFIRSHCFLRYLMMLLELMELYTINWVGEINLDGEHVWIWKEIIVCGTSEDTVLSYTWSECRNTWKTSVRIAINPAKTKTLPPKVNPMAPFPSTFCGVPLLITSYRTIISHVVVWKWLHFNQWFSKWATRHITNAHGKGAQSINLFNSFQTVRSKITILIGLLLNLPY